MKKVILVPDSFKGTMSSQEICSIMEKVILSYYPKCTVIPVVVADGGEGSVDAMLFGNKGKKIYCRSHNAYMEEVESYFGLLDSGSAIVEVSSVISLPSVEGRKNPSITTSYGVGEIIKEALNYGISRLIIALGGSCTNDAGAGLVSALGAKFINKKGEIFIPRGENLAEIENIDLSELDPRLKRVEILGMCDIDNPFYGEKGAAKVYAKQKGADEKMIDSLDQNLESLAKVIKRELKIDVQEIKGSGAAGAIGGGIVSFLGAKLKMGIDIVLDSINFDSLLDGADFVYTGEGKIDDQSVRGKVISGIAKRAKKKGVKVIAFVGDIGKGFEKAYEVGITSIFSINRVALLYEDQKKRAKTDLKDTIDNLMRYQKSLESV